MTEVVSWLYSTGHISRLSLSAVVVVPAAMEDVVLGIEEVVMVAVMVLVDTVPVVPV